MKENGLKKKKKKKKKKKMERSRYFEETIMSVDYADDLVLLINILAQA